MLLSHFDVSIASASGFPYGEAESSVPSSPQHTRKPWAQCEHAAISYMGLSSVEFQLHTGHFLPVPAQLCAGEVAGEAKQCGEGI